MRKIYLKTELTLIVFADDDVELSDIERNVEVGVTNGSSKFDVTDCQTGAWEVEDSK